MEFTEIISLFALGLIILIRTFLSMTLHLEIEGRWPWQPAGEEPVYRARSDES
jgi:hypothetical protein